MKTLSELFGKKKIEEIAPLIPAVQTEAPAPSFYWEKVKDDEIALVHSLDNLVVAQIVTRSYEGATLVANVNGAKVGMFTTVSAAEVEIRRYIGGPITNTTEGMKLNRQ